MALAEQIAERLDDLRDRIVAAGGDRERVRVVGVTKTFDADVARAAFAAGLDHLGENYAGELVAKAAALSDLDISWHYLGALQTNKVGRLAPLVHCFESTARERELSVVATRAPGARVLIQVDLTGQPQRNGADPGDVAMLVERGRALGLDVAGLMTVALADPDHARTAFRRLKDMANDLGLSECSMGMTDDLEIAVQEGSTEIRVGRALFGHREATR